MEWPAAAQMQEQLFQGGTLQEGMLQGGSSHVVSSPALQGGPGDVRFPMALQPEGTHDAHVGHVVADVSMPLEDDPMNAITLEVPTS